MRRRDLHLRALVAVLVAGACLATVAVSAAFAAPKAGPVKVAIMTDCKGAFAFGYEFDIGGAQAAFARFAGGKTKSGAKPSAGMTGISVGGTPVEIVGYGCGTTRCRSP